MSPCLFTPHQAITPTSIKNIIAVMILRKGKKMIAVRFKQTAITGTKKGI